MIKFKAIVAAMLLLMLFGGAVSAETSTVRLMVMLTCNVSDTTGLDTTSADVTWAIVAPSSKHVIQARSGHVNVLPSQVNVSVKYTKAGTEHRTLREVSVTSDHVVPVNTGECILNKPKAVAATLDE